MTCQSQPECQGQRQQIRAISLRLISFRPSLGRAVLRFWDPLASACTMTNQVAPLDLFTVAFSPDGKLLASCEGMWRAWRWGKTSAPAPGKVKLWSVSSPHEFTTLPGNTDWPRALGLSPDGRKEGCLSGRIL